MTMSKSILHVGVCGIGHRGISQIKLLCMMDDVKITAVCDVYPDRVKLAQDLVKERAGHLPEGYTDYQEMVLRDNLDAVLIFSSWTSHTKIAVAAMKAGKFVGSEVGGAASIEECWKLIRTHEETGSGYMILENDCYNRRVMATLNMVKKGLFGELIYLTGAYQHDLREEIGLGRETGHYRFNNFTHRNGELYPTHDVGPIAKLLNINRGNRFLCLSSFSTKARGLENWFREDRKAYTPWIVDYLANRYDGPLPEKQENYDMIGKHIPQGDVVTTVLKCAGGENVVLVHDCTLPRPRFTNRRIQGTRGIWMDDAKSIYIEGRSPVAHEWEDDAAYMEEFEHPLWKGFDPEKAGGVHGGTDNMVMRSFVESAKNGTRPPIDVYDGATWMAITALSEDSIAMGGAPVAFPDFTSGAWIENTPPLVSKYSLDDVYDDLF